MDKSVDLKVMPSEHSLSLEIAPKTEEKKTTLEFEDRLGAALDKHPKPQHLMKPIHAIEGKILELPKEATESLKRRDGAIKPKPAGN
jgi:hypothetical protein